MHKIVDKLLQVQTRIQLAALASGRSAGDITILAVSKTQSADAIRAAYAQGLSHFGENYLQEALSKQALLQDLPLCWHFIGPLQSNKTRAIAEHFSWVHSVDRLKIAQRLSEQRPADLPDLNICLQVNIDDESSKSGFAVEELAAAATAIAALPRLRLRGLMCLPRASNDLSQQRRAFSQVRHLLNELREANRQGDWDTLSMGMSADLEAAIAEGATVVRIGTAIFGERPSH